MEEITCMMGNVTSAVCGKASTNAIEEGPKKKTTNSVCKKTDPKEAARVRDTVQIRNKTEHTRLSSKKVA